MAVNVEWKARSRHPERQRGLAEQLSDQPPEILEQADTFFPVPTGRLKLRQLGPDRGELIFYQRSDSAGARESVYSLVPTSAPGSLRDLLAGCLGVQAVVRKRRLLCRFGPARIHCDEVEGLGAFLEVEVVLLPGQPAEEGQRLARWLQHQLEVQDDDLIGCAYADLPSAK